MAWPEGESVDIKSWCMASHETGALSNEHKPEPGQRKGMGGGVVL